MLLRKTNIEKKLNLKKLKDTKLLQQALEQVGMSTFNRAKKYNL